MSGCRVCVRPNSPQFEARDLANRLSFPVSPAHDIGFHRSHDGEHDGQRTVVSRAVSGSVECVLKLKEAKGLRRSQVRFAYKAARAVEHFGKCLVCEVFTGVASWCGAHARSFRQRRCEGAYSMQEMRWDTIMTKGG